MTPNPFGAESPLHATRLGPFTALLRDGQLAASRCRACGFLSFPPQADCPHCLRGDFAWETIPNTGTLFSFTEVHAAPLGFESNAPYLVALVELDAGGRALAWVSPARFRRELRIGMAVRLVARVADDGTRVDYMVEEAGCAALADSQAT